MNTIYAIAIAAMAFYNMGRSYDREGDYCMGNYRNFELTTYFVAGGTVKATKEQLKKDIAWFDRYLKIDKVYLEAFRDGDFATEEQVRMVKETLEEAGIRVEGVDNYDCY